LFIHLKQRLYIGFIFLEYNNVEEFVTQATLTADETCVLNIFELLAAAIAAHLGQD